MRRHQMILAAALLTGLSACAKDTVLERIYIDSLYYKKRIEQEHATAFLRWYDEDRKWKRGELGPDAPRPVKPEDFYAAEAARERMRFMEREFAAFVERTCAEDGIACTLRLLTQELGFDCNDATPIECWANTIDRADYYNYFFTRYTERHAWIVTLSRDSVKSAVQVRCIILPKPPY